MFTALVSLRRLHLVFIKLDPEDIADVVLINAPNLEYLYYSDKLALQYSVQNMPGLVKAVASIRQMLMFATSEVHHQQLFNLITPLSIVEHLSLLGLCTKALHFADVKDHNLPLFTNLKCLVLGFDTLSYWDKVLLAFLNRCPILETLVFPQGLAYVFKSPMADRHRWDLLESEQKFFKGAQTSVPQCCRFHLKRIVIKKFYGSERELYLIKFLLRQAYVLEELIVIRFLKSLVPIPDPVSATTTLNMLPRASQTCSIQVT